TLNKVADSLQTDSLQTEKIRLRTLLELAGEQGLLFFCALLTIPFLLPVSVPGVSTVFGVVIILIGIGVTLNRVPWLPHMVMEREFKTIDLIPALQKGAQLFTRLDKWVRPRLRILTHGVTVNRFNGLVLTLGGVLLLFPLGLVPLSNTLPALVILFLAIGILQRDGLFIIFGYGMLAVTVIYFSGLAMGLLLAGQGIHHLIG
ncbi:MAG TPA: exopolysaccharide biosynthesis protein, partial [Phototrophicaceae bacterium]|nr:exopolysaccharide biosynthesis protein [Phototrophicaceae bacterium]